MEQKNPMASYFVKCELKEGSNASDEAELSFTKERTEIDYNKEKDSGYKPKKIRTYKSFYIEFGFTCKQEEGELEKPLCLVCGRILENHEMKPLNLRRHLHGEHEHLVGKPRIFFERLRKRLESGDEDEGEEPQDTQTRDGSPDQSVALSGKKEREETPVRLREPPVKKIRTTVCRKYNSAFIEFGFISNCDDGIEKPQCIVCGKILSNESLKPSNLKRHLQTLHGALVGKPREYFVSLSESTNVKELPIEKEPQKTVTVVQPNDAALRASYKVAFRIAKAKKHFLIAEELILPCVRDICSEIYDDAAVAELDAVSLSKETLSRRITDLAADVEDQICEHLKNSKYYSLYIDEATDLTSKVILLVYTRYEESGELKEEMLCSLEVSSKSSERVDVFDVLNEYMTNHGISWTACVGVCTDGAAALTGSHSDFVSRIKRTFPCCRVVHSIIRHELLVASEISQDLSNVLNEAVRIVNYLKVNAINSRLFTLLCENVDPMDQLYLLNTDVRWLSRGKVLSRILEYRNEFSLLVMEKKPEWAQLFQETGWLLKLAYLADIFSVLNELNASLLGKMASVFRMFDKVLALKKKLRIWEQRILRNCFDMFPSCASIIYEGVQDFYIHSFSSVIVGHLRCLQEQFNVYCPEGSDLRCGNEWIRNPFAVVNLSRTNLNAVGEDRLIELSNDKGLEALFEGDITVSDFWMKIRPEYPELSDYALKLLLLFPSTNLCEEGYLAFSSIKMAYRNKSNIQGPLRIAISSVKPRVDQLVSNKQS